MKKLISYLILFIYIVSVPQMSFGAVVKGGSVSVLETPKDLVRTDNDMPAAAINKDDVVPLNETAKVMTSEAARAASSEKIFIGRYTSVEGPTDVMHPDNLKAVRIDEGDAVYVGDIFRTKSASRLEITFKDGSILRLAPNSRIGIKKYDLDEKGKRKQVIVKLFRGRVRAIVSRNGATSNFHIDTPNIRGTVRGTDVFAFHQADTSGVLVKEGHISIFNPAIPQDTVELRKGEYISVPYGEAPGKPRQYLKAELAAYEKETSPAFTGPKEKVEDDRFSVKMKGKITFVTGVVLTLKAGETKNHLTMVGEILAEGDKVTTGANGRVVITLENGNALYLQADSEIVLRTMRSDPETGYYNNTFESNFGKIKAVVEKLGKGSTFKIKTPAATCGVRGTVMYLNITPGSTQIFYEGGHGVIENNFSGTTQPVGSGQNASANINGNVSDPVNTTEGQRVAMDESWEGNASVDNYSGDSNDGGGNVVDGATSDDTGTSGPTQIFFTSTGGTDALNSAATGQLDTGTGGTTTDEVVNVSSDPFKGVFGEVEIDKSGDVDFIESKSSSLNGTASFDVPGSGGKWEGTSSSNNSLSGKYKGQGNFKLWMTDDLKYKANDKGRIVGHLSGTVTGGKLKGKVIGIFADTTGLNGTCSSFFTGTASDGTFDTDDDMTVEFISRGDAGVKAENLYAAKLDEGKLLNAEGSGDFGGAGSISLDKLSGDTLALDGQDWGIWCIETSGEYEGPADDTWKLAIGGEHEDDDGAERADVWVGTVNGTQWNSDALTGSFKGFFFSEVDDGDGDISAGYMSNGDIIGTYDDTAFTWEAVGGGEWVDVTDLLTEDQLGFDMEEFQDFISIPITEVYSSVLSGANAGLTGVSMDLNLFQNALNNIWAALITGAQSGNIGEEWSVTLTSGTDSVTLTGDMWDGGEWHALVEGTLNTENATLSGEAAGTYNDVNGTFEGVGGGVWEPADD